MTVSPEVLLRALDAIEDFESRHLVWSLVDESWRRDDLLKAIDDACPGEDPDEIFHALHDHGLIGEIPGSLPPLYRSRMAETVRLLANLRQLFPRKPWQSAPSLVADFRFRHEQRRFPRRDIAAADAVEKLAELPSVGPQQLDSIRQIIGTRQLSAFQLEATSRVIDAVAARADRGVVVGAGTGSGKTLAFYLPALSLLASEQSGQDATRVIAIYPRNELLKDQLAAALAEVRLLRATGGPQLRIGAYFGPSPASSKYISDKNGWTRHPEGQSCPYLVCPAQDSGGSPCGGVLVWRKEHIAKGEEILTCRTCSSIVDDTEFCLTRNSMQARPPDLLFTTTEMLNRSMSDGWSMHVFGVGPRARRAPELLLLDEAHTYSGVSGAQVGFLLRRWRKAVGQPVAMVGLSATLANAESFFSELTGIPEDFVSEVSPHPDDLVEQGRSYQIILRGDPASQTALLSTSIQSIMLLRRMLDSPATLGDLGVFGSKLFAFCDNLDLVNRLYRQMLDAEGLTPFNKPKPDGEMLAGLRLAEMALLRGETVDWRLRDRYGQYWWFAERIGCGTAPLSIGRTSSQDSGVMKDADVVVATASLEVGFDDPTVGAVLQHKAPRDEAQFLQRVGRAGRTQTQRPWTAVVLSDFGRDRNAYLDYEQLLDPIVAPRSLPMGNQSVRKMQAVFCFLDWAALSIDASGNQRVNVRKYFSEPTGDGVTKRITKLIDGVLNRGPEYQQFRNYLSHALRLTLDETDLLLWEQPRPLMLEALPTAFRRLSTMWGKDAAIGIQPEEYIKDHPLPDYVPRSLFDDLLLPEVQIQAPEGYNEDANTSMPVVQALTELAPGRVSLRWAVRNVLGLWSPIDPAEDTVEIEATYAMKHELLGHVPASDQKSSIRLLRPLVMAPAKTTASVSQKSNSFLRWELAVEFVGTPMEIPVPRSSQLSRALPHWRAYLHAGPGPIRIRRFAREIDVRAEIANQKVQGNRRFVVSGEEVAIGFELLVDAITFDVAMPEFNPASIAADQVRLRQLRRDLFQDRCAETWPSVGVDEFLGSRLVEVALAIVAVCGRDISELGHQSSEWWHEQADSIIDENFLLDDEGEIEQPLRRDVLAEMCRSEVTDVLARALPTLTEQPGDGWRDWIARRYVDTLAAAVQQAAQDLCPDFNFDTEVLVDVLSNGEVPNVLLSDATIGGGGAIESFVRRLTSDPRRFEHLVLSALEPTDLEEADRSLHTTIQLLGSNPTVQRVADEFRTSGSVSRLTEWQSLLSALTERGVDPGHSTTSALAARIFRPGSSSQTDSVISDALSAWHLAEQNAGFAFGQQLGALVVSRDSKIADELKRLFPAETTDDNWCQLVLRGLLWPRAEERRSASMQLSNRFVRGVRRTERTLVLDALFPDGDGTPIDLDESDWRTSLTRALTASGRAVLTASSGRHAMKKALLDLTVDPLDAGWVFAHPTTERVRNRNGGMELVIVLDEASQ